MSLQTWKDEFYPVPAEEASGDAVTALKHSLHKWSGLTESNLAKHGVKIVKRYVIEAAPIIERFGFFDNTCALCLYVENLKGRLDCDACPLVEAGHDECDYDDSAYTAFMRGDGGRAMRAQLRDTLVQIQAKASDYENA